MMLRVIKAILGKILPANLYESFVLKYRLFWIKRSKAFDTNYYLETYPDVKKAGVNPINHYFDIGWKEGRNPSAIFNNDKYISMFPHLKAKNDCPLLHFTYNRQKKKLQRNHEEYKLLLNESLFNNEYYLFSNPDVLLKGVDPIDHYLLYGVKELKNPSKLFDTAWYINNNAGTDFEKINPLVHYITIGKDSGAQIKSVVNASTNTLNVCDVNYDILKPYIFNINSNVCIFVLHTYDGKIHKHKLFYIDNLIKQGFDVILAISSNVFIDDFDIDLSKISGVIVRQNHGYDFALWACTLSVFPEIKKANEVLFVNDSVYGPLHLESFKKIFSFLRKNKIDIAGLTENIEIKSHIQSYFMYFSNKAVNSESFNLFWEGVKSLDDKWNVILEYELNWFNKINTPSLQDHVFFPYSKYSSEIFNPTIFYWKELIKDGFPFLKVQLLRDSIDGADSSNWQDYVYSAELYSYIINHLNSFPVQFTHNNRLLFGNAFSDADPLVNEHGGLRSFPLYPGDQKISLLPFDFEVPKTKKVKILVVAHVFHTNCTNEILSYIAKMPSDYTLIVTTDTKQKKEHIEMLDTGNQISKIKICENRGRDVAPLLIDCREEIESSDLVLHIHSKHSPHNSNLSGWREYLLNQLLGSEEIINSIIFALTNTSIGLLFPEHFHAVKQSINWGKDFHIAKKLLSKMKIEIESDMPLEFPSSTMFWCRSDILIKLNEANITLNDFEKEEGQIDGTFAHAIERSFLYITESLGLGWLKYTTRKFLNAEDIVIRHLSEKALKVESTMKKLLEQKMSKVFGKSNLLEIRNYNTVYDEKNKRTRLNLVVPGIKPHTIFGGMSTALKIYNDIADNMNDDIDVRIISITEDVQQDTMNVFSDYTLTKLGSKVKNKNTIQKEILDAYNQKSGPIDVRENDIFISTAWWTALVSMQLRDAIKLKVNTVKKHIYLIQDHEPGFYNWSSQFALAQSTYKDLSETISIVNSEELYNFMVSKYKLHDSFLLKYEPNVKIRQNLRPCKKEKLIVFYGRPSVARNCFELIIDALYEWQQSNPIEANKWKIVSMGEKYSASMVSHISNIEIAGKLSLEEYADMLNRAYAGISLMLSPHPSYPPFEMAIAGIKTITNNYDFKDMALRNKNLMPVEKLDSNAIMESLQTIVASYEQDKEAYKQVSKIYELEVDAELYRVSKVLDLL